MGMLVVTCAGNKEGKVSASPYAYSKKVNIPSSFGESEYVRMGCHLHFLFANV